MTSKLDHFRTPANVRDGEIFTMDNGLKVRVALPTLANRKYQFAVLRSLGDKNFEDLDMGTRSEAMLTAFNETCVREVIDEPVEYPLDMDEFGGLIAELFRLAQERAGEEDEKREKQVKKRKPT